MFSVELAVLILCFLSSANRIAEHFGGKLHLGYIQIREKLTEIKVDLQFSSLCAYKSHLTNDLMILKHLRVSMITNLNIKKNPVVGT